MAVSALLSVCHHLWHTNWQAGQRGWMKRELWLYFHKISRVMKIYGRVCVCVFVRITAAPTHLLTGGKESHSSGLASAACLESPVEFSPVQAALKGTCCNVCHVCVSFFVHYNVRGKPRSHQGWLKHVLAVRKLKWQMTLQEGEKKVNLTVHVMFLELVMNWEWKGVTLCDRR